jgi:malto-oligosyltrehalose trehalohydrolase
MEIAGPEAVRACVRGLEMNARMVFGPGLHPDGVTFRLWAPAAKRVDLVLDRLHALQRRDNGWYEGKIAGVGAGTLYKFRIDGEFEVPDPASHFQPADVAGPSEVIDHENFVWQADGWRGRRWEDAAFLELHVGTFTPAGSFRSTIERLDHVAETGLTAVELMPLADFAGARNWGYDGVLWYAPDSAYGRPEDLKALIDSAHQRGLMVFLDVVYNHFGPEGNYIGRYAPAFFTEAQTPWGSAIDYRVPEVRAFAIGNALHWLRHYRFDGLRLDAVHAIVRAGEPHLLQELSRAVGELASETGRQLHLVLENDDNRASLLDPLTDPLAGKYRAQWNDDYHHAWHVLLTQEEHGYYSDYRKNPRADIARILASGFAYQGETSPHRDGRRRGEGSGALSPTAFVNFLQNHDQIGNRALGDRLVTQADEAALRAALTVTLLAPMPPLLFMGEEWGSTKPFPFFCDFHGDLAEAVRKGRRNEFSAAYAKLGDEIPDPLAETTFRSAVLDWDACDSPRGRTWMTLTRALLTTRQREITPRLAEAAFVTARWDRDILTATWRLGGAKLNMLANFSGQNMPRPPAAALGRIIWGGNVSETLQPWSVYWGIGEA